MQSAPGLDPQSPPQSERDLFFKCEHCGVPLVVDRAAAGMILDCQRCGKPTPVPEGNLLGASAKIPAEAIADRAAELQRRLKENESQRTEITGYINQLNIQIHRWQLRLQTLNERNKELNAEIEKLAPPVPPPAQ